MATEPDATNPYAAPAADVAATRAPAALLDGRALAAGCAAAVAGVVGYAVVLRSGLAWEILSPDLAALIYLWGWWLPPVLAGTAAGLLLRRARLWTLAAVSGMVVLAGLLHVAIVIASLDTPVPWSVPGLLLDAGRLAGTTVGSGLIVSWLRRRRLRTRALRRQARANRGPIVAVRPRPPLP